MKKTAVFIIGILLCSFLTIVLSSCSSGVSATNANVEFSDEAEVGFKVKCPSCHHIGRTIIERISKGESSSGTEVCEKCDEVFEWSISR